MVDACPINKVCDFVCAVARHLVSKEIWGCNYNQNVFLAFLSNYIKLGRFENRNVSDLESKLKLSEMPWLCFSSYSGRSKDKSHDCNADLESVFKATKEHKLVVRVNHSLHTILLHLFLHWLFASFINPMISTMFYVTEGEGLGGQVLYYLKSIWDCIVLHVGMKQMESNFVKVMIWNYGKIFVT